ncbi:hypothetical protein PT2222_160127 [Paraburkholderia tropica]
MRQCLATFGQSSLRDFLSAYDALHTECYYQDFSLGRGLFRGKAWHTQVWICRRLLIRISLPRV